MKEKRIFIGSFTYHPDLFNLLEQAKDFFCEKGKFKWTKRPENLHLTYHFLGNTPVEKIAVLKEILSDMLHQDFEVNIRITGLAYFERRHKPTVLYAKIKDKEQKLKQIYMEIENRLFQAGFIDEIKEHFVPHITLARIKKVNTGFYKEVEKINNQGIGIDIKDLKIDIIESILLPDGAEYRPFKK